MLASELISIFKKMYTEHWSYEWGAAREGCVDCSGAFVYAFKQFGKSIPHGSNSIARQNIANIVEAKYAKPGYAVFKRRLDDEEPAKYRGDGWGNFYHVGLLAENGKDVYNAKSEQDGFSKDDISKWHFAMPLKGVEYDMPGDTFAPFLGVVNITSGYLNVRKTPAKNGAFAGKLYKNDTVTVDNSTSDGWYHITSPKTGWVSSTYIEIANSCEGNTTVYDRAQNSMPNLGVVIEDSFGNQFRPIGEFRVYQDSID